MQFFLDSAIIDEIKEAVALGLCDGVTTNPSLIKKSGRDYVEVLTEIAGICDGPVSAEVIATDTEGMLAEARFLAKIAENIVVKIPLTLEGLKAVKILAKEGIPTNVTLCFSANQALLAAKAGATYISPFVGRIDDRGQIGMEIVSDIMEMYMNYEFDTQVIVASVRNPIHVHEAALMGAHIATIPFKIFKLLASHPLTDTGIASFLKDAEGVQIPRN